MRALWYGETPYIETGAGQVAKKLLPVLLEAFSAIHLIPINQWWEQKDMPATLEISPGTPEDVWNVKQAEEMITACNYDLLFLTTDLNRIADLQPAIEHAKKQGKLIMMYAAIDCNIFNPAFFRVLELADIPIVFSNWCKRLISSVIPSLRDKIQVIYHGTEPDIFFPISIEERRIVRQTFFHIDNDETFLVINVNRNQVRKDLTRSMAAFHLFHTQIPDSFLYVHAKQQDLGGNLPAQAEALGLRIRENAEIIFAPDNYHEAGGISREDLNRIYNAADACISTATGEGWGLTTTEAMSAQIPFIGPNNTVFPEILGYRGAQTIHGWCEADRGYLVESGGPDLWVTFYGISDGSRELTSVTGMNNSLLHVYFSDAETTEKACHARKWSFYHTWSKKQEEWRQVFYGIKERFFKENNLSEYQGGEKST